MARTTPARKYGPLIALGAAQLVIVLLVPSVAPNANADAFSPTGSNVSGFTPTGADGRTPPGRPAPSPGLRITVPAAGWPRWPADRGDPGR